MAIAFIRGQVTRSPFFKTGDKTPFAACSVKEVYTDRDGKERLGGYHDIVAFGEDAQQLALYEEGDELEVKANVRYRPDKRFVSLRDIEKNPFTVQFVVMEILSTRSRGDGEEEDPFDGA